MDTQNQTEMKFTTSDGIEFSIVTNDVIELTEAQFDEIVAKVVRMKTRYIVKDGIDISELTVEQANAVIEKINSIVGDSEYPIVDGLIILSRHVEVERLTDQKVLEKRGWYRKTVKEIQDDIANVVKNVREVQKAKLQFLINEPKTRDKFTFTILGVKVNGESGKLSIAFVEDNHDFVMVVTVL